MYFSEEHDALRQTIKRVVDAEINPNMDAWEETTAPLHDLFKKMGNLGLLGICYDPAYGGRGLHERNVDHTVLSGCSRRVDRRGSR